MPYAFLGDKIFFWKKLISFSWSEYVEIIKNGENFLIKVEWFQEYLRITILKILIK